MSTSAAKSTQTWWQRLPPKQKQWITIIGSLVCLMVVILPFLSGGPSIQVGSPQPKAVSDILPTGGSRELGLAGLAAEVDGLKRDLAKREEEIGSLRRQLNEGLPASAPPTIPASSASTDQPEASVEILDRLSQLESRLADQSSARERGQGSQPQSGRTEGARVAPPGMPGQRTGQTTGAPAPDPIRVPTLRSISAPEAEAPSATEEEAAVAMAYLPSGSIIQGVLLTGLDAPTGRGSRQDPVPVLVRIKHDAILPNRFRADIKECFMLLAGMGDLSSERAYLRGEAFSCVREDGGVIDIPLNVYAVGEDGKAGLRGTLVSKQGQAIGKAMLAGIAQSTSQAFSRGGSGYSGGGSVDLDRAAESGVYGGAGSALDRVAQFYIDLAEQIFPVIEVAAGREVSLVLVRGAEIRMVRG